MNSKIISLLKTALALALVAGVTTQIQAEDKKPDPVGTWNWTFQGDNGNEIKSTLTLKKEGEKLAGKVVTKLSDDQTIESKVEDAKVEGDKLSFVLNPEVNGNTVKLKFSGKLTQEEIKGDVEVDYQGQNQSFPWEAKREKK